MGRVTFLGAAGCVTGSATLLELPAGRFLIDCGLFQGDPALEARNRLPFAFQPNSLDGVILTHAHLDHSGLLPRLVDAGFRGPVWATRPTRMLVDLLLEDFAQLETEGARYATRKGYSRHARPEPLYTLASVRRLLGQFELLAFGEPISILPGVEIELFRAGHLLGAASVTVAAGDQHGARKRWCFSGDVGRFGAPILLDPEPPTGEVDQLVLEATYGDRDHLEEDPARELERIVRETFSRGGSVLIPAFALGRTQDLLYHLRSLVERGALSPAQLFVDSPMALRATEIYRRFREEYDPELNELEIRGRNPLEPGQFVACRSQEDSKALNQRREPAVIVASSGMADGGRILHHLKHRLPIPETTVVFVGFQATGTRGRALLDGSQVISIHGEPIPVRARICRLEGLSAHAGRSELLRWVEAFPARPRQLFLNHAEEPARQALRAELLARGWPRPELPVIGAHYPW